MKDSRKIMCKGKRKQQSIAGPRTFPKLLPNVLFPYQVILRVDFLLGSDHIHRFSGVGRAGSVALREVTGCVGIDRGNRQAADLTVGRSGSVPLNPVPSNLCTHI